MKGEEGDSKDARARVSRGPSPLELTPSTRDYLLILHGGSL